MPIWNRQHGQCNFLLKWFVRTSLCTYGSQSLACLRYIDRDRLPGYEPVRASSFRDYSTGLITAVIQELT